VNRIASAILSTGNPTAIRIARSHPSFGLGRASAFRYGRTLRSISNRALSFMTPTIAIPFQRAEPYSAQIRAKMRRFRPLHAVVCCSSRFWLKECEIISDLQHGNVKF
jgi:hypothetical protein